MLFEYGERYYKKRENKRHYLYLAVAIDKVCADAGIPIESFLDIGCASGKLISEVRRICPEIKVVGVDHGPVPERRFLAAGDGVSYVDFDLDDAGKKQSPQPLLERYSVVSFIEVIEHLDPANEDNLVDLVSAMVGGVMFFTGAKPGQRGYGHANCKSKEHWIGQFAQRGLRHAEDLTATAVKIFESLGVPFSDNLVVYKRV